jgi:4-hydroxybenzoate polyprenyltransferase
MRTAGILWRSTHPGPTVVVTVVALALGWAAGLDAARLAVLTASVFFGQVSIGLSNDVLDAGRDRLSGRTDKPLAADGAPVRVAWVAAFAAAIVALALSAALGWWLALAHAVFLACGWAYNAVLKATVWSPAGFVVGFGVFPSLASLALPQPHAAPWWAWVAGAVLGIAVHFSNVLPDLEDDLRTGVRGLPHRIGRRGSAIVAFVALIVGAAAAIAGPAIGGAAVGAASWIAGAAVVALAVWGLVATASPPRDHDSGRLAFRLVMLSALLLAAQLVIASWGH